MKTGALSNKRWMSAGRAALLHMLLSVGVAALVALLIFGVWFPSPLQSLTGGRELFWLIVSVDVVCGPLLTLVVFNPAKPRTELTRDLLLVALIQVGALAYGVHTLSFARPVVLAFEKDRFRVVTYAELDEGDESVAAKQVSPWSLKGPQMVGTRAPVDGDEFLVSVGASLDGVEPSQRPSWWQSFDESRDQVLSVARPVSDLLSHYPEQSEQIRDEMQRAMSRAEISGNGETLRWLPLVSGRTMAWVVLIEPQSAHVVGYLNLDGFIP